jgi:hypothetical protein
MITSDTGDQWVLVDGTCMEQGCPPLDSPCRGEERFIHPSEEIHLHDLQGAESASESGSSQDCGDTGCICTGPCGSLRFLFRR